jgi:hypothetical protein
MSEAAKLEQIGKLLKSCPTHNTTSRIPDDFGRVLEIAFLFRR